MTIREVLKKRVKLIWLLGFGGFFLIILGLYIGDATKTFPFISLIGLASFVGAILFQGFGLRCPKCRENMQFLLQSRSEKMKVCPYCVESLDSEI